MIFLLWCLILLMILIALGFIVWPFLQNSKNSHMIPAEVNRALYNEQLVELERELDQGFLDPHAYKLAKENLLRNVLNDLSSSPAYPENSPSSALFPRKAGGLADQRSWITILTLSIVIPMVAIILYLNWGASTQLAQWFAAKQQQERIQSLLADIKTPEQLIAKMQQALKKNPKRALGWYLLGKIYLSTGQIPEALDAFAKAYALEPKNTTIAQQYAKTKDLIKNK